MNEYLAQAISEVNNLNEGEEFLIMGISSARKESLKDAQKGQSFTVVISERLLFLKYPLMIGSGIQYGYIIVAKYVHNPKFYLLQKMAKMFMVITANVLFFHLKRRDWSKFERFWDKPKVEKFDPKTLQPFDKVLVRDSSLGVWGVDIFGYLSDKRSCCYCSVRWNQCVPYNEETKHLVGTDEDCSKYYKWWEE